MNTQGQSNRNPELAELDADAAIALARSLIRSNELSAARTHLDHALAWARIRKATAAESMALAVGATLAMRMGDYPSAAEQGEEALLSSGPFANPHASAEACLTLSMVYADIGLAEEAMRLAEDARTFAELVGDTALLSWAYTRIADARALRQFLYYVPELRNVLPDYRRARQLAKQTSQSEPKIAALNNLVRFIASNPSNGDEMLPPLSQRVIRLGLLASERVMEIITRTENSQAWRVVEPNHCAMLCKAGRFDEGIARLERFVEQELHVSPVYCMFGLFHLGSAYIDAGHLDTGRAHLNHALKLAESTRVLSSATHIHYALHFEAKKRGDLQEALSQLELAAKAKQLQHIEQSKIREKIDARVRRLRDAIWQVAHARMDAETDPLTNVLNRRGLPEKLGASAHLARVENLPFAIAMIDLDRFKPINDLHGHLVGDQVLKVLAQTLKLNCRENDVLSRYGGDEFVLGAIGTSKAELALRCEELRRAVSAIDVAEFGLTEPLAISVGVAEFSEANEISKLLQLADSRLYFAKQAGRNRVETVHST